MKTSGEVEIPALPVRQPIGEFFIGVIDAADLLAISFADIREIERDLDNYLGIQRKLNPERVKDLTRYVKTKDATFPTSIILAVDEECAEWNEERKILILRPTDRVDVSHIAKILDGQHRVEGLRELPKDSHFQLNVTIFVDADIADQANIFATVNLAQTKVNASLVYDLFDYAKSRSPQKTAHEVAVALDRAAGGPFFERIKRLGTRTPNRTGETLTQATVVTSLLDLIAQYPMSDRDILMRGKRLNAASEEELKRYPFRNLFIEEKDVSIAKIVNNYFAAVQKKWPVAWEDRSKGNILARTNGFRAFMRAFKDLYIDMCGETEIGTVIPLSEFSTRLSHIYLKDGDFNTQRYPPGTSGETALYKDLATSLKVSSSSSIAKGQGARGVG